MVSRPTRVTLPLTALEAMTTSSSERFEVFSGSAACAARAAPLNQSSSSLAWTASVPIITLPAPGAWTAALPGEVLAVAPEAVVLVPVLPAVVLPVLLAAVLPVPCALPVLPAPCALPVLLAAVLPVLGALPVLLAAVLPVLGALPVLPTAVLPGARAPPVFTALRCAAAESRVASVCPATPPAMLGGGTSCSDCPLTDLALPAGSCPCRSAHPDTHAQRPNIPTHAHRLPIQSPRVPIPRYVPGDLCKRRAPINQGMGLSAREGSSWLHTRRPENRLARSPARVVLPGERPALLKPKAHGPRPSRASAPAHAMPSAPSRWRACTPGTAPRRPRVRPAHPASCSRAFAAPAHPPCRA